MLFERMLMFYRAGPAMTYSMETIGWLDLNLMDKATEVWPNAYANAQVRSAYFYFPTILFLK